METTVDTRALPEARRRFLWEQATASFLVPLDIEADGLPVTGRISGVRRQGASFCRLEASPHRGVRTKELADGIGGDSIKFALAMSGTVRVSQHGRTTTLAPGQWAVYDTGEEYCVGGTIPFGLLIALVPRELLALDREQVAAVAATAFEASTHSAALIGAASGRIPTMPLINSLADVVHTTQRVHRDGHRDADAIVDEAAAIIQRRLHDPALSPGYLAAVLGVSRRYIYTTFGERHGPVSRYVRAQRLARAYRMLTDAGLARMSVAAIALECGFTDAAYFSRVYRARFGHPPANERL